MTLPIPTWGVGSYAALHHGRQRLSPTRPGGRACCAVAFEAQRRHRASRAFGRLRGTALGARSMRRCACRARSRVADRLPVPEPTGVHVRHRSADRRGRACTRPIGFLRPTSAELRTSWSLPRRSLVRAQVGEPEIARGSRLVPATPFAFSSEPMPVQAHSPTLGVPAIVAPMVTKASGPQRRCRPNRNQPSCSLAAKRR